MKEYLRNLRRRFYQSRGIDPDPVIVTFWSGPEDACRRMQAEVEALLPKYRHIIVALKPIGIPCAVVANPADPLPELRTRLRSKRVGMAAVLFDGDPAHDPLRRAAFLLAPTKILAFNPALERLHLRPSDPITSGLFLSGMPLDRARLRPRWWPFPHRRTERPDSFQRFEGRSSSPTRIPVHIVTPYLPWPLSHGGAVRIYSLLKEVVSDADVHLLSFVEPDDRPDLKPLLEYCNAITLVKKPFYLEPGWSSLVPSEVAEYRSPGMERALEKATGIRQIEYTQLAEYGGDVLVEHDVTLDLYKQLYSIAPTSSNKWDLFRWERFERKALRSFPRVVVMSEKDASLVGRDAAVIPNGVDLNRFRPTPEPNSRRLLFVGSFRHFPNVQAFQWFWRKVWPLLDNMELTVVAGLNPERYCELPSHPRLTLHAFVPDVAPLYCETNLVVIPTQVSAGTNLKALEGMASARPIVSTPSGVAGLGLVHGESVIIAETPQEFANAIADLLADFTKRTHISLNARRTAVENFGWPAIARKQVDLWRGLRPGVGLQIRPIQPDDHRALATLQQGNWNPADYPPESTWVALLTGEPLGFLASRQVAPEEFEILNIAVSAAWRRHGIALRLLRHALQSLPGKWHLEVRESNAPARALYARLGFTESGRRPRYYENPQEDAILLLFFPSMK